MRLDGYGRRIPFEKKYNCIKGHKMVQEDAKLNHDEGNFNVCQNCFLNLDITGNDMLSTDNDETNFRGYCLCGQELYQGSSGGKLSEWKQIATIPGTINVEEIQQQLFTGKKIEQDQNLFDIGKDENENAHSKGFDIEKIHSLKIEYHDKQSSKTYTKAQLKRNEWKKAKLRKNQDFTMSIKANE
jgi:hypothetical protein